jgi:GH43 family beta-xylosidase
MARRRSWLSRVAMSVVMLLAAGVVSVNSAAVANSAPEARAAGTFTNPLAQRGPDPWLQYFNGFYYLATTTWNNTITMRRSRTLGGLAGAPETVIFRLTRPNGAGTMWAPEFHLLDGPNGRRWYLYYTAGREPFNLNTQRIHVLESAGLDPMGPYIFKASMLDPVQDNTWELDGSILRLNGRLYLLGTFFNGSQPAFIRPLSNPWTASGTRRILSTPTFSWERVGGAVNEGPEVIQRNGRTFIVFSASHCSTPDYKLGLLTYNGGDPLNQSSWVKSAQPIFQRNDANRVFGPGHNGFFKSPDGTEDWIVYHATSTPGGCDLNRSTRAQKITWNADGTPNFGVPVRLGTTVDGPAGETAATPTSYRIVNRNSGKCLEVAGGSTADGANIQQWTCNGGTNQRWRLEDLADDTSRLVNVATGKAADVADCGTADGVDIRQWPWLNNTCQRFRLVYTNTGGWMRLVNQNSGRVADVADCGTADGVDVRQWTWLNNNCQQWSLQPV